VNYIWAIFPINIRKNLNCLIVCKFVICAGRSTIEALLKFKNTSIIWIGSKLSETVPITTSKTDE